MASNVLDMILMVIEFIQRIFARHFYISIIGFDLQEGTLKFPLNV